MPTKENDPWWAYFYIKHLVHKEAPPLTTGKDAKREEASEDASS